MPQGPVPSSTSRHSMRSHRDSRGEIDQRPPPYSAKKVGGKKLYEIARDGKEVEVEPKRVTVHDLQLGAVGDDVLSLT